MCVTTTEIQYVCWRNLDSQTLLGDHQQFNAFLTMAYFTTGHAINTRKAVRKICLLFTVVIQPGYNLQEYSIQDLAILCKIALTRHPVYTLINEGKCNIYLFLRELFILVCHLYCLLMFLTSNVMILFGEIFLFCCFGIIESSKSRCW